MKKLRFVGMALVAIALLAGCYPRGAEFTDDTDIVITYHNDAYDFSSKSKYAMPDQIVKVTGNLVEGDDPEFIPDVYAGPMLSRIEQNMTELGWERVAIADTSEIDILLMPAAFETTYTYYYYDYYYWWYGGYYPYYGYGYPAYYSTYSAGTLVMTMRDPKEFSGTGTPLTQWAGAVNGLLSGSFDLSRATEGIDRAFELSPYLATN